MGIRLYINDTITELLKHKLGLSEAQLRQELVKFVYDLVTGEQKSVLWRYIFGQSRSQVLPSQTSTPSSTSQQESGSTQNKKKIIMRWDVPEFEGEVWCGIAVKATKKTQGKKIPLLVVGIKDKVTIVGNIFKLVTEDGSFAGYEVDVWNDPKTNKKKTEVLEELLTEEYGRGVNIMDIISRYLDMLSEQKEELEKRVKELGGEIPVETFE